MVVPLGGERMSHLFNHNGAENTGYSQPVPLSSDAQPVVPEGLIRKASARWPRLSEPEMVRHYTCSQSETSVLILDSTHSVPVP